MSSRNLTQLDKILPFDSDRLRATMRRRPKPKDVLSQRMKKTGRNPPAIRERASEKGASVSAETVKAILRGESQNAGLFTWEALAIGLDVPPLELIAELLGEQDNGSQIKSGRFTVLNDAYRELSPTQRAKADILIEALLRELQHIRGQR